MRPEPFVRVRRLLAPGLAVIVLAVVIVGLVLRSQRLPAGPQSIAWDAEPCAHCRMLIGEPGFAAQLQTREGRVLDFDDPGCLLRYLDEVHPEVHAIFFHHAHEDRWLAGEAVAFRRVAESPMGWRLAAVGLDEPHDLDRAGARAVVAASAAEGGHTPGGDLP